MKRFGRYILLFIIDFFIINVCNRTIPIGLLSADDKGEPKVDMSLILDEREQSFVVDTSKPFKLNFGTTGVCTYAPVDC